MTHPNIFGRKTICTHCDHLPLSEASDQQLSAFQRWSRSVSLSGLQFLPQSEAWGNTKKLHLLFMHDNPHLHFDLSVWSFLTSPLRQIQQAVLVACSSWKFQFVPHSHNIYYLYLYRKYIFRIISTNRTTGIEPLASLQSISHFFFSLLVFVPHFSLTPFCLVFTVGQQREGEVLSLKVLPVTASWAFPLLK